VKSNLTEIVFILDRSGSMAGLESDTIGGFNSMLARQKQEPGEAVVTTVLFDDRYELLHDRVPIRGVAPITEREYTVRGTTALLDAIGKTIHKIGNAQKNTAEPERACKVLIIITTDGLENASRSYTPERIRMMIDRQKEQYGWEFIFLGANIDAVETAGRIGIHRDMAVNYMADESGTQLNYAAIDQAILQVRSGNQLDGNWKKDVEEDYNRRAQMDRKNRNQP